MEANASRNEKGVALKLKNAPTWLAESELFSRLHVIGCPAAVDKSGSQRKFDALKKSLKNETRNVPAYDVRKRPVDPNVFGCSISVRARSSASSIFGASAGLSSPVPGATAFG